MNKIFIISLITLACINASVDLRRASRQSIPKELPLIRAYATKSGTVPMTASSYAGFQVQVDVAYNYDDASDSDYNTDTVDMLLALYTSQTVFAYGCGDFNYFECSEHSSCYQYTSIPSAQTLPYFNASGYEITTDAYLDYSSWSLSTRATLATSCQTNAYNLGEGTQGIIGLGRDQSANFIGSDVFSIYLTEDGTSGKLMFESDMSYADGSSSTYFSSSSNWTITGVTGVDVGSKSYSTSTTNIMFDVNSEAIGLPTDIYNQVIEYLSYYAVSCPSYETNQPSCTYYSNPTSLPSIFIYVDYYTSIEIPPQIYVQNVDGNNWEDEIVLNIKAIGSDKSGSAYVTPGYNNYIIFDSNFMRYYYTVFDGSSQGITIYKASAPTKAWVIALIAGSAALFLVLVCCCCCAKNARAKRTLVAQPVAVVNANTSTNVATNETVTVSLGQGAQPLYSGYQQPPVFNNVPVNGYYPPQQGGYGYLPPQQPVYGTIPAYDNNYQNGYNAPASAQNNFNQN